MKIGNNITHDMRFMCSSLMSPGKKKGLYVGHVGYKNLGDEALRDVILELLKPFMILTPQKGLMVRLLEKMKFVKFDTLLLGGGTLLLRSEGVAIKMSATGYKKKIVFGTGAANQNFWKDVTDNYGQWRQWHDCLKTVDYIGVRGPVSQSILRENFDLNGQVEVIGDPVLFLLRELKAAKPQRKHLGINMGTTTIGRGKENLLWGRNEPLFLSRFAQFLRLMQQDGWSMEVVPVCAEDLPSIRKVLSLAALPREVKIFKDFFNVNKVLDRMESYDMFIGQKLHSVVLAYCANTPAVMVEYRPKCRDFMKSINLESLTIRTDEFTPEKAKVTVDQVYARLEEYRHLAHGNCALLKQRIQEGAWKVRNIVCGVPQGGVS